MKKLLYLPLLLLPFAINGKSLPAKNPAFESHAFKPHAVDGKAIYSALAFALNDALNLENIEIENEYAQYDIYETEKYIFTLANELLNLKQKIATMNPRDFKALQDQFKGSAIEQAHKAILKVLAIGTPALDTKPRAKGEMLDMKRNTDITTVLTELHDAMSALAPK